jgi:hypothetical protein
VLSDVVGEHIRGLGVVRPPEPGRLVPA